MPELPEVETIKNDLNETIVGLKIKKIKIHNPSTIKNPRTEFINGLIDKKVSGLHRVGKTLIINFFKSASILIFHLKMTGQLIYCSKKTILAGGHSGEENLSCSAGRHTRLEISFSDNSMLFFNDLRKFGYAKLAGKEEIEIIKNRLGPEPHGGKLTYGYLSKKIKKSRAPIKALLLDQKIIAGIGNIYADEILFASKIHPGRPGFSIKSREIKKIIQSADEIIKKAIENRGTTFNNYVDASGRQGRFLKLLNVYGRKDKACPACGQAIKKTKVAGRGTHYCHHCQK
jgi:formamidopyrimidine-DNA glycosylase